MKVFECSSLASVITIPFIKELCYAHLLFISRITPSIIMIMDSIHSCTLGDLYSCALYAYGILS